MRKPKNDSGGSLSSTRSINSDKTQPLELLTIPGCCWE